MDTYEPRRKRTGKARERQTERQRRHAGMVVRRGEDSPAPETPVRAGPPALLQRALPILRDIGWHLLHQPKIWQGVAVVIGVFLLLLAGAHLLGERVFPNIWSMDVDLGGLSLAEAQRALEDAWGNARITLVVEGQTLLSVAPADLGLQLDAQATVEHARSVGMSGLPFGYDVPPVVSVDYMAAQTYLLNLTDQVEIAPANAGYRWQGVELIGVPGSSGRALDVVLTLQHLQQDPAAVVQRQRLDLLMSPLPPDVSDPAPFLEEARVFASQSFVLTGYDPYRDETIAWTTIPEEVVRWLEATPSGLAVRPEVFSAFITSLNTTLNPAGTTDERYIEPIETVDLVQEAINRGEASVTVRIRYRPTTYQVVSGDTGFRIARKTGLPYYLIQEFNSGRNLDQLFVGDIINLPSRDATMPLQPLPNKRIIVNLDTQSLVAYENGQPVFSWAISSGVRDYPTYPGVYQILTHNDVALGSSFTLCSDNLCGQWEMYWFMGIYEVVPGLMNGFHGAVLLPNGAYLGGGNVGSPYTFGCVMSENSNAQALYNWAEIGTVVEIISSEYAPQSDLARAWLGG
ncbi:MAG: peptidoglycan binding domain-containing protein [Chloroflexi bacterium]|nr:peptidoglycan binding domain-containing protein [Chloroflexota bacterium]